MNFQLFLEKDAKRKMRGVFSLFEEEEKNEVMDSSKNKHIGIGKVSNMGVCVWNGTTHSGQV